MAQINGEWFRSKLTEKNRSQRALAKYLGLDPGAVTLIFQGRRKLQLSEAEQMARFLGEPLTAVLRAAGLPLESAQATTPNMPSDPLEALKAKRDRLLGEVEILNKAIELLQSKGLFTTDNPIDL